MSSFLSKIQRGKQAGPVRLIVHGAGGTGKSTFASGAPSPLFLDTEARTGHLNVARVAPSSWEEVQSVLRELITDPGEFRTLVIDTLDSLELLIHRAVCATNEWKHIEEPGFGKGYAPVMLEWARFNTACELLRNKGVMVLMLAHSAIRTVTAPGGDCYDMMAIKLKGGAKTNAGDFVAEKADLVGYAHFEDLTRKASKNDAKAKAVTTGARLLTFAHSPVFQTKRGVDFPDEIPLTWAAFEAALGANRGV